MQMMFAMISRKSEQSWSHNKWDLLFSV